MVKKVFSGQQPPLSKQTSLMVFGTKPQKTNFIQAKDKQRISLLNVDFKLMTGVEAKRMRKTMNHTVSPLQLVAGDDRRLHHGVAMARDAIQAAGKNKTGCGILDTDLVAAFDWLCMDWVQLVLLRKGMAREAVARITNLYYNNSTFIVVNNKLGKTIENRRHSLRQGDKQAWSGFASA